MKISPTNSILNSFAHLALLFLLVAISISSGATTPTSIGTKEQLVQGGHVPAKVYAKRTPPYFPEYPPSCPICAQNYGDIDGCIQAAPVLANFSLILFNPGAFFDVIRCACADTFKQVFPQCVDCFIRTNQTEVIEPPVSFPAILEGVNNICALESTLLGNVSAENGEVLPEPSPSPTLVNSALSLTASRNVVWAWANTPVITGALILFGGLGLLL